MAHANTVSESQYHFRNPRTAILAGLYLHLEQVHPFWPDDVRRDPHTDAAGVPVTAAYMKARAGGRGRLSELSE